MRIADPTPYLHLGALIRYLIGVAPTYPIDGEGYVLANLKRLRESLVDLKLVVSTNHFDSTVKKYVTALEAKLNEHNASEGDKGAPPLLEEAPAAEIAAAIRGLEDTVFAEAKVRMIAVPTAKRIATEQLFNTPDDLLGQGIHSRLTEIARTDWDAACRCLAFECCTAAAFHALRSAEECIRVLHRAYFPRRRISNQTWGQLTSALKNKPRNPRPDTTLLTHLDHIRQRFRNPTDHPDKTYDLEETEDLLHLVADVINRCMRDPRVVSRSGC